MDISKLPKWAQEHITRLQRDHDELKSEVKNLTGAETSNISYRVSWRDNERFLPKYSCISFELDTDGRIFIYHEGDSLRVSCYGALHVVPNARNSVVLKLGE